MNSTDLSQAGYRTLAAMLRDLPAEIVPLLNADRLNILLQFVQLNFAEIEHKSVIQQHTVLTLFKCVIQAGLVNPIIYDLMAEKVPALVMQSEIPSVRELAGNIFLNFLMHYPLGTEKT